ncbi:uncharacterized protein [Littorina saxatilis]|uniref:uncharacterized protein n=1 Tax=Littorina saxatilis TaxID=31220 RepID=UPI0038B4F0D4
MDVAYSFNYAIVILFCLGICALPVTGSPCTDNSHACPTESQQCIEQNTTSGYVCECKAIDEQLDLNETCIAVPESQRLYLAMPIRIRDYDAKVIEQFLKEGSFAEAVEEIIPIQSLPSYKGIIYLKVVVGAVPVPVFTVQYMLVFEQNVTEDILLATSKAVLAVEARKTFVVRNLTIFIDGHTGIFRNKDDIEGNIDAVDWCAYPSLHNCSEKTKCRDVALRYECPCDTGFFLHGDICTDAVVEGQSPLDTDGSKDLRLLCKVSNASEVTQYKWTGASCREHASCVIRPQPPLDDGRAVTCQVTFSNGQSASATFVIRLNYPPQSAPLIESSLTTRVGDRLTMTCTVDGGKPPVTSVNFSCPGHPDVTPDISGPQSLTSVLNFPLSSADDSILCSCSAQWKTGEMYSLTRFRVLTVKPKEQADSADSANTSSSPHYSVYIIPSINFVMLLVISAIVVSKLWCRKKERRPHLAARFDSVSRRHTTQPKNDFRRASDISGVYVDVVEHDVCCDADAVIRSSSTYLQPVIHPSS